jgi:hypothetical protein
MVRNDDLHTNHAFHCQIFFWWEDKVLYLLHTPLFYVGIHSKTQEEKYGQKLSVGYKYSRIYKLKSGNNIRIDLLLGIIKIGHLVAEICKLTKIAH